MKTAILNFDFKMTEAQRATTAKFLDRPLSRNFYYENYGTVTGLYGFSYDKTYFRISENGDAICYSK
tara:strand:- start:445 stop:645 length:201 start_codon:yes stop_codon:yes gene_type:complete